MCSHLSLLRVVELPFLLLLLLLLLLLNLFIIIGIKRIRNCLLSSQSPVCLPCTSVESASQSVI